MSSNSDCSVDYTIMKERNKNKRWSCYEKRIKWLKEKSGYEFEEKSNGYVRIYGKVKCYDVWLTTGKWTILGTNKYRQGWNQLIDRISIDNKE